MTGNYILGGQCNRPMVDFYRATLLLSAVHDVVVCLTVCLSVHLQTIPHDRLETLVFKWDVLQVAEFLPTSASRGPSAIAEPLVPFILKRLLITHVFPMCSRHIVIEISQQQRIGYSSLGLQSVTT